ncbi:SET domain-containing protein [Jiangella asiatica]|uniref:SET domain-containing protein n=1 Tax=Jiangella asiatica TaxID=2530372 RepID=A0A4R5CQ00_9ACTN|nr:SET domain-containing protein [Jiangella asiatica]TDE02552.1 SET domain-containing protein [Jiangella asiatica]
MATVPEPDCWLSSEMEPRASDIEGWGLFARVELPADALVARLGGRLVADDELRALFADPATGYVDTVSVGDGVNLVLPPGSPLHWGNHSCEPNLWWEDPYALRTRHAVPAGAELTLDYGTVTDDAGYELACRCGTASCRGTVTGTDWRRPELRAVYGDHWVPVLRERIAAAARSRP